MEDKFLSLVKLELDRCYDDKSIYDLFTYA